MGVSNFIKSTFPNYLSNLPVPDSFGGWFQLSFKDWLSLIPPTVVIVGIGYCTYHTIRGPKCGGTGSCNSSIRRGDAKVVDMIDANNISATSALCRCWKTKSWPYCDGSHAEHNKNTGDNLGPLVIRR
ncbi:CG1458 [Drosophila busckii]|uniref:CG1458 n=1 Tax=Drosophila busckii TaxID=30019 RepID=A0A0M5JBG5_DROBS|nr:CG1458 [Drosophila busckii]